MLAQRQRCLGLCVSRAPRASAELTQEISCNCIRLYQGLVSGLRYKREPLDRPYQRHVAFGYP